MRVLRSLGALADESESSRAERAGRWGVSTKYYSVEDEHDSEVVEHLIGSAFVLAQTSITQAVSLLKRMREDAGCPVWIPKDKAAVLSTAAPVHAELGISQITVIHSLRTSGRGSGLHDVEDFAEFGVRASMDCSLLVPITKC